MSLTVHEHGGTATAAPVLANSRCAVMLVINLQTEHAIPIREVPRHVPRRNGKKVHYSTVYRWVTKGVRGKRLESVMVGGIRYTTTEAIGRFLNGKPSDAQTPRVNESDLAVDEALRRAGV